MTKARIAPHRGHAWCSLGLCVPQQLHDSFEAQLGPHVDDLDLIRWYEERERQRVIEGIVVEEVWTWWREAFRAELRARGWTGPTPRPRPTEPRYQPWECAHTPRCLGRWQCGQRERLEALTRTDYSPRCLGEEE